MTIHSSIGARRSSLPGVQTSKPLLAALCGSALLLTGCGGGHGHTPEELDEMIADTVRASAEADPSALPDAVFDPDTFMCSPAVDSPASDVWRTEAPRSGTTPGEPVRLGVLADGDTDVSDVTVTVLAADEASSAEADLVQAPGPTSNIPRTSPPAPTGPLRVFIPLSGPTAPPEPL
ncbi:hypothetical protein [Nocardiopsis sp. CNR-923]|uniref:hypothetical protein n=1 Tax=Nocardiopsis sp. CNR-923 TaxID=1904965 RepID=UPI0021CC5D92|nr:hypothetical protein [Nocardiopsis sp. CNR-923]